ncbi:hypothetical protein QQZ08_006213 [Neonectria magnoliae]|uniref:Xylose isomerase-like TIM barrel domain-containing protein n=1 Tax=Neonectria magnoliae TaxID=2732573 RepID=A0ABR1I313_9HYPO
MPEILRFRTTWGIPPGPNFDNWKTWFPTLKKQGYFGVEIDFACLPDPNLPALRQVCEDAGLEVSVLFHTAWPGYAGPRPTGLTPDVVLGHYREQLQIAQALKPFNYNAHSGSLRITADISHWVVVCERLLDQGEEDKEILKAIIPHVSHIHARVGTTQSSQCPDPTNPAFAAERAFFENFWKDCIKAHKSDDPITWVPEYGPFPYHPFGSARDFSEVADTEGARLQPLFEEWAKGN